MNSEIQFGGYAHDIEDDRNKVAEITKANTNETNYPSTAAVVKAISEINIPEVDLSGKMDKFGEVTETDNDIVIQTPFLPDSDIYGKNLILKIHDDCYLKLGYIDSDFELVAGDNILKTTVGGGIGWDLNNTPLRNVREPQKNTDAATKGYVDNLVSNAKEELSPDKNYDPESVNAQSGKAVAEALAKLSPSNQKAEIKDNILYLSQSGNTSKVTITSDNILFVN